MEIPYIIKEDILYPFISLRHLTHYYNCTNYIGTLFSSKYFVAELKNYSGIVPVLMLNDIKAIYNKKTKTPIENGIFISSKEFQTEHRTLRTFNSVIRRFRNGETISKINTTKGEYYVGRGIILDKNMNLLILYCTELSIDKDGLRDCNGDRNAIINVLNVFWKSIKEPIVYISPRVFYDQKDLINKGIVQKIIPVLAGALNSTQRLTSFQIPTPKIIVSDEIDKFINSTTPPVVSDNINEDLNSFLLDNFQDIENHFYGD